MSTVVRGSEGNSLFEIGSEEFVTSAIVTVGIVCGGNSTKSIAAVVHADFLGHFVVATTMLCSFGLEITHERRGAGEGKGDS